MGSIFIGDNEYYTYEDINKTGANYRIAIGERSNGKTYGFKQMVIDDWIENKKQFAYLRRYKEEVDTKRVSNYWNDILDYLNERLKKIYDPNLFYNVFAYRGNWKVWGVNIETEKKVLDLGVIGYYFSLGQVQYDKSNSYPDVTKICFEEFITDKRELKDEFTAFTNFISTIKRKRTDVVVYLIGNTINRNNQILTAMGINVRDLTQGEIKLYKYYGQNNNENTVAVEYCKNYAQSAESESYFIFNHQQEQAIIKGEWQTKSYRKFEEDEFYGQQLQIGIVLQYAGIKLYAYITTNRGYDDYHLYVSDERMYNRIEYITFAETPTNPRRRIFNIKTKLDGIVKVKQLIMTLYTNDLVSYKDNLVGCDFEAIIPELGG